MIGGELARRAEELAAMHTPFVAATVVRAQRPTSVRPGDAALVHGDGTIEGFIGGTCAQSSVRLHASRALETGEPLLLRLVPGSEESRAELEAQEGAVVAHNACLSGGSIEIFLEPHLPALRLIVVGDSPIARALEEVARAARYDVVRGGGEEVRPQPGDAAVVVASHGSEEELALARALAAGVGYVALVASPARGAAVREALDVPDELRSQLHTPAGFDIDARSPAEIAIAILAEFVAERHAHPAVDALRGGGPTQAATAIDPVCGMEVVAADPTLHLDVDGELVYFCCEGCRTTYAERHAADVVRR
jgi:xanthine dehydrogenase accessory factor